MRRLSAPRSPTAVAVVTAIFAVLAVMVFPGVSIGATTTSHGGSPSDVFMSTDPGVCFSAGIDGGTVMEQELTLDAESHLLVYFTSEWGTLKPREEGLLHFDLDGPSEPFEWGIAGNRIPRTSGTVMWSFENVSAGQHTVGVHARVDVIPSGEPGGKASTDLNDCALTVFVIPAL